MISLSDATAEAGDGGRFRHVPHEKRSQFLERIAAMLRLRGSGHFNDDDVSDVVARALRGMTYQPAA